LVLSRQAKRYNRNNMNIGTYPKLKFKLNLELDINIATQFLDIRAGGIDFGKGIIELYPSLRSAKKTSGNKRKKIVREFTINYYQFHKKELQQALEKTKKDWRKREKDFFKETDKIFNSYPWPEGDYICYLSIFNCNPRFLETKTFQVYYKHPEGTNHVIAHEMLHFIFFDYLEKKEKQFVKNVKKDRVWLLSESFNEIVLELPQLKFFKSKQPFHYPETEKMIKSLKSLSKGHIFTLQLFLQKAKTLI